MATLLEQLETARVENARLSGEITIFRSQLEQVPGGDFSAFLAEHGRRGDEITRLTGELSTSTTRSTGLAADVTRLTGELATAKAAPPATEIEQRVETRAAEIVAGAGVPPAAAETAAAASSSGEPANFEAFLGEYNRLHATNPSKAGAYYSQWWDKFK